MRDLFNQIFRVHTGLIVRMPLMHFILSFGMHSESGSSVKPNNFELFWDDYNLFIKQYQKKIHQVVNYISANFKIDYQTKQDLIQDINLFLLNSNDYLHEMCYRDGNPRGYINTVITNECMRLIKNLKIGVKKNDYRIFPPAPDLTPEQQLMIKDEVLRLKGIMMTFYDERPVIELCLKISFHYPIYKRDILKCFGELSAKDIEFLNEHCGALYKITEQNAHKFLKPYFDQLEKKDLNFDSRIRTTANRKKEIIKLLNKGGMGNYDKKALKYLFDIYFYDENDSKIPD